MMELIASIPLIGGFLASALPFIVVLGIVVFVHEYGHYIVGRWCGIHAETFSLGFGPVLTSWRDKRGTKWQVAALPLGGFVKFLGDADGASRSDPEAMAQMSDRDKARSFHGSAVWRRMLTVAAGPFANFILSIVVFAGITLWQGLVDDEPRIDQVALMPERGVDLLETGDLLLQINGEEATSVGQLYAAGRDDDSYAPVSVRVERDGQILDLNVHYPIAPLVFAPIPFSPADAAGLERGDFILSLDGQEISAWQQLQKVISSNSGEPIALEVFRDGEVFETTITPKVLDTEDGQGGFEQRMMIGISAMQPFTAATFTPPVWTALGIGVERTYDTIAMSLNGMKHIIIGSISASNLQGPLGIAQMSGKLADSGLLDFIALIAVISTAIGLLNLFPIPVLDGGHLMIFAYEAVAGRPPNDKVLQVAMSTGLAMVLLLMVFATYNDVVRLLFVS